MSNFKTHGDSRRDTVEERVRWTEEREDRGGANMKEVRNGGGRRTGSVSGEGRGEGSVDSFGDTA